MNYLFWCGNIALMDMLPHDSQTYDLDITLENETVEDDITTYTVVANHVRYLYRFSMTSNTRLEGTLTIEGPHGRSPIYMIDKRSEYIHIEESPSDFRDIYFVSQTNVLDIYVKNNKKSTIAIVAVDDSDPAYHVSVFPLQKEFRSNVSNYVRALFAMSGVVNRLTFTAYDVISYVANDVTLYVYKDKDIQVIGVETTSDDTTCLQCVDSVYDQSILFKEIGKDCWKVNEAVDGVMSRHIKRAYTVQMEGNTIFVPERNLSFQYEETDGNVHFTKQ